MSGIEFVRKWDRTGDAVRFRVKCDGHEHDGRITYTALLYVSGEDAQAIDYDKAFVAHLPRILAIASTAIRTRALNADGFWISESDV
ncbi:DUF1488 family protein [Burkholderia contaminans]|uniref:DUF1488 family protein n=1 Tax=Burkholderia contaminans TaxID=488447 RepID=UPI001629C154|nr:DUF1488 family protein [Burkholderia contaminans]